MNKEMHNGRKWGSILSSVEAVQRGKCFEEKVLVAKGAITLKTVRNRRKGQFPGGQLWEKYKNCDSSSLYKLREVTQQMKRK